MSDRLHEIIAEIGIIHDKLTTSNKIKSADEVFEFIESYDKDVQEHYLNLLLQYYFQKNDLANLKELLLVGAKFDMRFDDVKAAFLNIKSNKDNVIEFMEDTVIFIKDSEIEEALTQIYNYYMKSQSIQTYLEESIEIIKRNRYICAHCYKNEQKDYSKFFLNEDLLESLKRDLPYLLK